MNENYADKIKTILSAEEVCRFYGIEVNRGKAKCPFHHDMTPSMYVYPGTKGWYCFVCNKGGSVIDLVMNLFNLSFKDAMCKLNDDFHLGFGIKADGKTAVDYAREAAAEAKRKREFAERQRVADEGRERRSRILGEYLSACDRVRNEVHPFVIAQAKEEMKRKAFLLALEDIKQAERRQYESGRSTTVHSE